MRRLVTGVPAAVTAGVTLSAMAVTGVTAAGAAIYAARQRPAAAHSLAVSGVQLWVKRYNGPGNSADDAYSVAVSPDGAKVFVTGISYGTTSASDYATIAYDAATGARLWVKRYNGPAKSSDQGRSLAVSPDGGKVFVTGTSIGAASETDYATIAYSAATGARLWVKRYNGPANDGDEAASIAAAGNGNVYVTGASWGGRTLSDYATVAYSSTGTRLWVKRYNDPRNANDYARSVAVSRAGKVFVAGGSAGAGTNRDYATVAYSAAGTRLWVKRYNGPGNGTDDASSLAAPGNGVVYVTGSSGGTRQDYATIAYDAFTGGQLWVRRYNGPGNGNDEASSLAARSGRVFVTGRSEGISGTYDYVTIAYNGSHQSGKQSLKPGRKGSVRTGPDGGPS
jgi:hypothetical protein